MSNQPIKGSITVYESSDGGSGDPAKTKWQFFVAGKAVHTNNPLLAETARLAIRSNSQVSVTTVSANDSTLTQIRIEY